MDIGFDVISDLYLSPEDSFNWENKATSLYCCLAGNVSSDLRTVVQTLTHLSRFYQGVFYTPGTLEYTGVKNISVRTRELLAISSKLPNIALLYHHVVTIDGIAVLGCNGWTANNTINDEHTTAIMDACRYEDVVYLHKSVEKLQTHLDIKKILIMTNAVPKRELYFGEEPESIENYPSLDYCKEADTENKITNWVFGTHEKIVDTIINGINYVNNPYLNQRPYWAKRLTITI